MFRWSLQKSCRMGLILARQQTERGFAEKAVLQDLDWDKISGMVHSEEGKRELANLRSAYWDMKRALDNTDVKAQAPDWAHWRKALDPKLVDEFKKEYDKLVASVPLYDPTPQLTEAETKFAEMVKNAEQLAAEAAASIEQIDKELEQLDLAAKRLETATIDEELAADPAMAAEVDKEVMENHFLIRS